MSKFNQNLSEAIIKNIDLTKWGIYIIAVWASVLALLSLAKMLVLSSAIRFNPADGPSIAQIWIVFGINALLLPGFGLSAYGLFKRYSWGRILFLWVISIWASFNLIILFAPPFTNHQDVSQRTILSVIRYILALVLPILYLNLPQIKLAFRPLSEIPVAEDRITNDNID